MNIEGQVGKEVRLVGEASIGNDMRHPSHNIIGIGESVLKFFFGDVAVLIFVHTGKQVLYVNRGMGRYFNGFLVHFNTSRTRSSNAIR